MHSNVGGLARSAEIVGKCDQLQMPKNQIKYKGKNGLFWNKFLNKMLKFKNSHVT